MASRIGSRAWTYDNIINLILLVLDIAFILAFTWLIFATIFLYIGYWQNHSIKEEPHCVPEALRGNECLVGVQHWAPGNVHYCSVEPRLEGTHCSSGAVASGHCDGAGACIGDSDLECAVAGDCPALTLPAGLNSTVACDFGRCSYSVTAAGPFGTCGSVAATEVCTAAIADADIGDSLTVGELCDSGLVIACVYTATGAPVF